jgi:DHA1 family tetracycline resistance protein-like MFS transporter
MTFTPFTPYTRVMNPGFALQNAAQRQQASRGALAFALTTIFLDMLGTAILIPVLPYIVRLYNTDALTVGLLSVVYSAAQFGAAPILGWLSDRYGRRPVLLVSVLGSALGYYLFGIGGALWVLFLARLIDGITGGNISTAQACIADVTPPQDRAKNFAMMGAVFSLGFILGPAIGGVLGKFNVILPALAAGTLSLLSVIFGYFMLPESLSKEKRATTPFSWSDVNPLAAIGEMAARPGLGVLLFATFVFNFVYGAMANNFSVYTIEKFRAPPFQNATIFTLVGTIGFIIQAGVVQRLVPRFGEKKLALGGLVLQVLGFLGIVVAPAFWLLYPISALIGAGNAFMRPTLTALISNGVSFREQGKVAGVTASLTSLTYVLGPLWAGASYDYVMPSAPYWSGALLLALTWLLVARLTPV